MNERNWGGARKGAGRKPTGDNTEMITLTLTKEQAALLRQYAKDANLTVSKLVVKWFHLPVQEKKSDESKR